MNSKTDDEFRLGKLPQRSRNARIVVAFSGGMDSTVLLHALSSRNPRNLCAVHVHHGLQAQADQWAAHCGRVCTALDVPLQVQHVIVRTAGKGLEAAAREARYSAFSDAMRKGDVLVTAHHLEDQAETVLMRLLRGSGTRGMAAMRESVPLHPGVLWRPLLRVSRSQIARYAQVHALEWIDDPHNQNPDLARSYLRHEILPRLQAHWPGAAGNLSRFSELSADADEILREVAELDFHECTAPGGPLPIEVLKKMTRARRHNLLRHWVEHAQLPPPFQDSLDRLDQEVMGAAQDADPVLNWPGAQIRRYRNYLFVMAPLPDAPLSFSQTWDGCCELVLPQGCGRLRPVSPPRRAVETVVRMAQSSDRFSPFGSSMSRTLKNLFQERGVPTWVRARTPVVEREGRLIWVGGLGWASGRDWTGLRTEIQWADAPPAAIAVE